MLPGVVLCAVCLLLPAAGNSFPTPPLPLASPLIPSRIDKATSELNHHGGLPRIKRNLDLGGILKTIGVGVDLGGPQLGFNTPNVTLDTPIGTIGALGSNCRNRRDDGSGRRGEAESLEASREQKRTGINISF